MVFNDSQLEIETQKSGIKVLTSEKQENIDRSL